MIDIHALKRFQEKPDVFEPGEKLFWTDPHIASQMLAFHLDPNVEAASRRSETIQRSVEWIMESLSLRAGDALLDLGCGPGLYASRFARLGLRVSAVDFSQNSIDYARKQAELAGQEINYRCQDYLTLDESPIFDAAVLIYGDYCVLPPQQRARLLANIRRALKPAGKFVFDVSTPLLHQQSGLKKDWYAAVTGFWKPGPHLVLEQGFDYPDQMIFLDQYLVLEAHGKLSMYRNWFQNYTPDTIRAELEAGGFVVESLWNDLTGTPFQAPTGWIGIVASKPG